MAEEPHIYRVIFHNQGQVYEVFAREIFQSELMGFIEVEGYLFGSRTQMVVDPSEEKLKSEFAGVSSTLLPLHSIIRIDEVEKEGIAKITDADGKVTPFPVPFFGGPGGSGERR